MLLVYSIFHSILLDSTENVAENPQNITKKKMLQRKVERGILKPDALSQQKFVCHSKNERREFRRKVIEFVALLLYKCL